MATFYVDAVRSYPGCSGLSELDPLASISAVNSLLTAGDIVAGDTVLFRRGQTYGGASLSLAKDDMIVGSYGSEGDGEAILSGQGVRTPLILVAVDDLTIKDIKLYNDPVTPTSGSNCIQMNGACNRNVFTRVTTEGGEVGIEVGSTPSGAGNIFRSFTVFSSKNQGIHLSGTGEYHFYNGKIDGCGLAGASTSAGSAIQIDGSVDARFVGVDFGLTSPNFLGMGIQTTTGNITFDRCATYVFHTDGIFGATGGDQYSHTAASGGTTFINCILGMAQTDQATGYLAAFNSGATGAFYNCLLYSGFNLNSSGSSALVLVLSTSVITAKNNIALVPSRKHPYFVAQATASWGADYNWYGSGDWPKAFNATATPGEEIDLTDWLAAAKVAETNPITRFTGIATDPPSARKDFRLRRGDRIYARSGVDLSAVFPHDILGAIRDSEVFGVGPFIEN